MNKKLFSVLLVLAIALVPVFALPFGLGWGASVDEVSSCLGLEAKVERLEGPYSEYTFTSTEENAPFNYYTAMFLEDQGLICFDAVQKYSGTMYRERFDLEWDAAITTANLMFDEITVDLFGEEQSAYLLYDRSYMMIRNRESGTYYPDGLLIEYFFTPPERDLKRYYNNVYEDRGDYYWDLFYSF